MPRMIDANAAVDDLLLEWKHGRRTWTKGMIIRLLQRQPTLTPPPASSDLISRSALLRGETEPEIITGSDSELAEQFEWRRWMDKIKRAPAVGKEEES